MIMPTWQLIDFWRRALIVRAGGRGSISGHHNFEWPCCWLFDNPLPPGSQEESHTQNK